jgi:hypothetical protein
MKKVLAAAVMAAAFVLSSAQAATGIFGGYVTIGGTKYKSSSSYGGPEPVLGSASLGSFNLGGSLVLSQGETLTFQDSGHSTFGGALAYRVRLSTDAKSTNPGNYSFITMGDGVSIGGNDEKFEFTGQSINLLSGLNPTAPTTYNIDIVHKVGAWEGGSNFERLASISNTQPGSTSWGDINAFTAEFTVIPEPSTYALLGLAAAGLGAHVVRRRRR